MLCFIKKLICSYWDPVIFLLWTLVATVFHEVVKAIQTFLFRLRKNNGEVLICCVDCCHTWGEATRTIVVFVVFELFKLWVYCYNFISTDSAFFWQQSRKSREEKIQKHVLCFILLRWVLIVRGSVESAAILCHIGCVVLEQQCFCSYHRLSEFGLAAFHSSRLRSSLSAA